MNSRSDRTVGGNRAAFALLGLVVAALVIAGFLALPGGQDRDTGLGRSSSDLPWCEPQQVPATADPVVDAIQAGGPFPYPDRDGGRFGNYEELLPDETLGFYREYTVPTPGLDHRGARRIVTGGETADDPDIWFYTSDHYASFCEFDPEAISPD